MNVLEYTEEQLKELSSEELMVLLKEAEDGESLFNTQQMSAKLQINSLYGALGNRHFPLFNQAMAQAITGNGRYFIASLGNLINLRLSEKLGQEYQFTIAGDTDSVYFSLNLFVQKHFKDLPNATVQEKTDWVDEFVNTHINPVVQECIDVFAKDLNAFEKEAIGADREIIADKGIFCAKKKYFARVIDSEGVRYTEPKMKVIGLEIARSSTPSFVKKELKDKALGMLLDGTKEDIQAWSKKTKEEFVKQPLDNISKTSGVARIDYDLKGSETVPINSRASIVYNNYIVSHGLEDKFNLIQPEDKIKMAYLISPNPFNSNVIGFIDGAFLEPFREFVDFDTNYEKYFSAALEIMAAPLGYDLNRTTESLDDW
jgi:hypothetical protein